MLLRSNCELLCSYAVIKKSKVTLHVFILDDLKDTILRGDKQCKNWYMWDVFAYRHACVCVYMFTYKCVYMYI